MGLSGGSKKPPAGAQDTQVVREIQAAKEPSEFQKRLDARAMKFFDWDEGKGEFAGKPKDVTEAPGFSNLMDIYGNAEAMAGAERMGDPIAAFSGRGTSSNPWLARIAEQNKMKRYDARASGLNQGLADLKTEATSGAMYGNENAMRRNSEYVSNLAGFNDRFYNRPQRVNPWMQALGLAVGGLGAAGGVKGLQAI